MQKIYAICQVDLIAGISFLIAYINNEVYPKRMKLVVFLLYL